MKITEKPMVIQYVGSASITYVEGKFQTMASANNNMYGVPPKYLRDLSHVKAAFISPVRYMVMYLLIRVGNNDN